MPDVDLAYPIGPYVAPPVFDGAVRAAHVAVLAGTPQALREAVAGLQEAQLDTPYRPGGWTVRQVVHHVPDSHMNAYVRFKLALTEERPAIRTYEEALWATLPDACEGPIEVSLALLDALHTRWVACIQALPESAFQRTFVHPALGEMTLDAQLALYAWHSRHHVAHITRLADRMGWPHPSVGGAPDHPLAGRS